MNLSLLRRSTLFVAMPCFMALSACQTPNSIRIDTSCQFDAFFSKWKCKVDRIGRGDSPFDEPNGTPDDVSVLSTRMAVQGGSITATPQTGTITLLNSGTPVASMDISISRVGDDLVVANPSQVNSWLAANRQNANDFAVSMGYVEVQPASGTNVLTFQAVSSGNVLAGTSNAYYHSGGGYTPTPGDR